jgi:SAM-dependent MidA family methyltransferase
MQQDHTLLSILQQRIAAAGGWIPFDRYMQAALYEPGLGYYESADVFGSEGDFITGPDLGPWLAKGFADLVAWGWQALGQPSQWTLMEQGGGSGALLCGVLLGLAAQAVPLPSRIIAVEASARMRARQSRSYQVAHITVEQVESLDAIETMDSCIMFCNELPDAFPVRCLIKQQGTLHERGVGWDGSSLTWANDAGPMDQSPWIDPSLQQAWPEGYITEWNPGLDDWQMALARIIRRGLVFCVDYGFTQREYYRPNRIGGTLLAHYQHHASEDVFIDPGSRDITAHVDFTALAHWGRTHGLPSTGFLSQGAWLAQSPSVQAHIATLAASPGAEATKQMAHVKRLLMPSGMGEVFKLLIQRTDALGPEATLPPFLGRFDRVGELMPDAASA